jgi:hypothetical protein
VPEAAPRAAFATPPTSKSVALAVEPIDAHVFDGTTDLGTSPVMLDVPAGSRLLLEARHAGYKPSKITVDGSEARKVVSLEKLAGRAPRATPVARAEKPAAPAPAKKRQTVGSPDIVNPWGN